MARAFHRSVSQLFSLLNVEFTFLEFHVPFTRTLSGPPIDWAQIAFKSIALNGSFIFRRIEQAWVFFGCVPDAGLQLSVLLMGFAVGVDLKLNCKLNLLFGLVLACASPGFSPIKNIKRAVEKHNSFRSDMLLSLR